MAGQDDAVRYLAGQVSAALEAADLAKFADLLDPDVQWGPPGDPVPPCRNRSQVLSWYRHGRESGARGRVTATAVSGDRILVGLKVTGTRGAGGGDGEHDRWQVLTVREGRVAAIVGFDNRDEAAAWAGLGNGPSRSLSASWSPPRRPLADDLVVLRLPELSDAEALHDFASRPGGVDDSWIPLPAGASAASCAALAGDWLAGWRGEQSFHGPAFVIVPAGERRLAGQVGLADRGERVVELVYGVAPMYRGRGFAAHGARLVANWLLTAGLANEVELRVGRPNLASQRVAAAAGFVPAGTVTSHVPGTGARYEDLRFVLTHS